MEIGFSQYIAIFLSGAVIEAVLLIRNCLSKGRMLFVIFSSAGIFLLLAAFSPLGNRTTAVVAGIWLAYFIFSFPFIFKKDILPVIGRRSLVGLTVIFWYIFFVFYLPIKDISYPLGIIAAIFSSGVMVISIAHWQNLHKFWRLFNYAWFLMITLALAFYQISFTFYSFMLDPQTASPPGIYEALIAGMAAFYLGLHIWYFVHLVPFFFFDKKKSTAYALWAWKLNMQIFAYKYHNEPLQVPFDVLIVAGFCVAILFLNWYIKLLPPYVLVDMIVLYFGFLSPKTRWAYN
jgi:hypothetical protein